jgi:hypothetical protein
MPALPIFDKGFTQEEINFGLEKFAEGVQQLKADYDEATCPLLVESGKVDKIRVDVGRVYWKLVKHRPGTNNHTSVYCFVRKADGAILKAASWNAPALNHARGFVTESDHGLHCAGPYGVAYLR